MPYKYYLSIGCICKDENAYLKEWLDYHLRVGVEHFYIYDNGSRVPLKKTVADYIRRGLVDCFDYPDIKGKRQLEAYMDCCRRFKNESFWIGFIDIDEFLVPKATDNLPEFLIDFEDYSGLVVSWLFFGSSGHIKKPPHGVLTNYLWRASAEHERNKYVKSIVRPLYVSRNMEPHSFCYSQGIPVDEDQQRVRGYYLPNKTKKIQLNHYFLRSREEYKEKSKRGRGDKPCTYPPGEFERVDRVSNKIKDSSILRYLDR